MAEQLLGMDRASLIEVLDVITTELQETAAWFEVDLGDIALMESIQDQAKETLMLRNLQSMQQAAELHKKTESLETRTRELEEETRRDGLTGLYNRAYLDQCLLRGVYQRQAPGMAPDGHLCRSGPLQKR